MERDFWQDVESFARAETCLSRKKMITPATRVFEDLDQTGDEANDFMEGYFEKFKIDRGDYDFHRYFLMEGEGILYHFVQKYLFRRPHTFEREVLTVGMLHRAVVAGKWDSNALREGV